MASSDRPLELSSIVAAAEAGGQANGLKSRSIRRQNYFSINMGIGFGRGWETNEGKVRRKRNVRNECAKHGWKV